MVTSPNNKAVGAKSALLFTAAMVAVLSLGCSPIRMMVRTSSEIKEMPELYGIPYEEVWIGSENQSRLHAYYVSGWPERPVVVFFHGNAGNISDRVPNLCYLRTIGTPILIFDYRGYGLVNDNYTSPPATITLPYCLTDAVGSTYIFSFLAVVLPAWLDNCRCPAPPVSG